MDKTIDELKKTMEMFYPAEHEISALKARMFIKDFRETIKNRIQEHIDDTGEYWKENTEESFKNWETEMHYISDRFDCGHRLQWLLDFIDWGWRVSSKNKI